jgi:hypothetical protein
MVRKDDVFIGMATRQMLENKVGVCFHYRKTISKCRGYTTKHSLHVAARRPTNEWLSVFAHEYGHFLQNKDEESGKKLDYDIVTDDELELFDSWLVGRKNLEKQRLTKLRKKIQRMEADCEIRTISLIKKYDLPIDIPDYIRGSNAYLIFYNFVEKYRTWCKKSPSIITEIKDLMPNKIKTANFRMSKRVEELILEHCM